jgi:hypothetical protein
LDQADYALSLPAVRQQIVGPEQAQCAWDGKQLQWRLMALTFSRPFGIVRAEKHGHRHTENLRDLGQSTRADPVHPFFVFLDLLKRHTKLVSEGGLR